MISSRTVIEWSFYYYGLLLTRHQKLIILFLIFTSILLYPFALKSSSTTISETSFPTPADCNDNECITKFASSLTPTQQAFVLDWPSPYVYVQKIHIRSIVSPWTNDLEAADSVRLPLALSFEIVNQLKNISITENNQTISLEDLCLKATQPSDSVSFLPSHDCLVMSPSNIWKDQPERFKNDENIIRTLYNVIDRAPIASPVIEVVFGLPWTQTGIPRYFMRSRPRMITYSVSVYFKKENLKFIAKMRESLSTISKAVDMDDYRVHLIFTKKSLWSQILSNYLIYQFIVLFLYVTFHLIPYLKGRLIISVTIVVLIIVLSVLSMLVCTFFNIDHFLMRFNLWKYTLMVVGLENSLVLLTAITTTPAHLDPAIRVSIGLGNQGYPVFRNMVMLFSIFLCSIYTWTTSLQEFAIFGFCSILIDHLLQFTVFALVVYNQLEKMEITEEPFTLEQVTQSTKQFPKCSNTHFGDIFTNKPKNELIEPIPAVITNFHPKISWTAKTLTFLSRNRIFQTVVLTVSAFYFGLSFYKRGISHSTIPNLFGNVGKSSLPWWSNVVSYFDANSCINFNSICSQHFSTLFSYYGDSLVNRRLVMLPSIYVPVNIDPRNLADISRKVSRFRDFNPLLYPEDFWLQTSENFDFASNIPIILILLISVVYVLKIIYNCICPPNYSQFQPNVGQNSSTIMEIDFKSSENVLSFPSPENIQEIRLVTSSEGMIALCTSHNELVVYCVSLRRSTLWIARENIIGGQFNLVPIYTLLKVVSPSAEVFDVLLKGLRRRIMSISMKDCLLAVGCGDGHIEFWNTANGSLKFIIEDFRNRTLVRVVEVLFINRCLFIAFNTGRVIVVTFKFSDNRHSDLRIEYASGYEITQNFQLFHETLTHVAHCCSDYYAATGDYSITKVVKSDQTAVVFKYNSRVSVLYAHLNFVVAGYEDGRIDICDLVNGLEFSFVHYHDNSIPAVQIVRSHLLVSCGLDHRLCISEISTCQLKQCIYLSSATFYSQLCRLWDDRFFITGGFDKLFIWDAEAGVCIRVIEMDSERKDFIRNITQFDENRGKIIVTLAGELFLFHFDNTRKNR